MTDKTPGTILLVEDDQGMRFSLSLLLEGLGYVVNAATNGHEALTSIHAQTPSLILTDLHMPGMNGVELAKTIRSEPQFRKIPIFLLSGKATWEPSELMLFSQVLTKPVPFEVLENRIKSYMSYV